MKRLAPGVYDDGEGGMHLEFGELLRANGWADTPENRAMLEKTWREWCAAHDVKLTFVDEPIAVCTECDGKGTIIDAPANVLDGRSYSTPCPECGGTGRAR